MIRVYINDNITDEKVVKETLNFGNEEIEYIKTENLPDNILFIIQDKEFSKILCENCGQMKEIDKIEKINIGKEQFYICNECIDTINKFKQRHKI